MNWGKIEAGGNQGFVLRVRDMISPMLLLSGMMKPGAQGMGQGGHCSREQPFRYVLLWCQCATCHLALALILVDRLGDAERTGRQSQAPLRLSAGMSHSHIMSVGGKKLQPLC